MPCCTNERNDRTKGNRMKTMLFVCTGNTCRSAMAEGICNAMAKRQNKAVQAASCGLAAFAGDAATPQAVAAAAHYGADLTKHRARPVSRYLLERADAVYCMTRQHKATLCAAAPEAAEKVFCLAEQDITDPFGGTAAVYEKTAAQIAAAVERLLRREAQQ